ncbi:AMP-binding protein [Reyranella sp. CPCC 100927]|nr:acyl-CoA synthetase [Reyranella sp. CPCC 100927]TWS97344.1 AMP-binding protein [Reyranella sp. CPCC 100927]
MDGVIVSGARELKQATLFERAARAASGFAALGIGENGAVALVLRNDFAFFEAAMGAGLVGAYAVPVNWHFKADEAGYIVTDCGAKAVVVHADLLPQIKDGIPADVSVFVVPTPPEIRDAYGIAADLCAVPPGAVAWDDWVARQTPWNQPPRPARTNMIYTSGTTGRPKGVRREPATPEMQAAMGAMVARIFDIRPGDGMRTVVTGPVYHSAPNLYALSAARDGGLVILQPRFDAEDLLRQVEQHRITHLHMVPTMFVRLLKLPPDVRRKYDLSSLKFVTHAAAPCPPDVKRQMIEWWGPIINEYYGGTETGGAIFHNSEEALRKPGTVGKPIPGAVVKILDAAGKELGPNDIGEVYLRIGGFPDFTYNGMDEKRREIERQGLITCGDVGYVDDDGYLFLCDRVRDMVISGGVNIYPAEIEAVLIGMPGVQDCAVFGIPDEEYGESLAAYVEPQEGADLTADAVRTYLRERTAGYKVPKLVEFQHGLPREDSGKIFKRKLRAPYWEKAGRQI